MYIESSEEPESYPLCVNTYVANKADSDSEITKWSKMHDDQDTWDLILSKYKKYTSVRWLAEYYLNNLAGVITLWHF